MNFYYTRIFYQCPQGISFSDMTDLDATVLVNTVADNRYKYLDRDYYIVL